MATQTLKEKSVPTADPESEKVGDVARKATPAEDADKNIVTAAGVCKQGNRAGPGMKRFKIRADGHPSQYVAAADKAAAEAIYRTRPGLDPAAKLVTVTLPD